MWKDWPQQLCDAGGFRGLVYSRNGYGRSTPREPGEKWPVDFMHRQAREVLPAFLDAVGVGPEQAAHVWLVGHSDGGSISLLFSAAFPDRLAGAVVLAPICSSKIFRCRASRRRRRCTRRPTCARNLAAITTTSIRRFGVGTISGWTRRFASGIWSARWRVSRSRCSRSRARTTSTARWRRWTALPRMCRTRA
ncbi:alpha/beta fold hydrolase [Pandoraea sp. XY-2]|uniref:alpha/beta fold hydrolase n=1 Tax=Pandoraea sp. XY-2 TaxID=2518599 RepID=UPI0035133C62